MSRTTALLCRTAAFFVFAGAATFIVGAPAAITAHAAGAAIKINATELTPSPNPSNAYNRMVDAMGLFKKHDLVLELGPKLSGGGPARVQAVVTNATEVATSDIISVLGGIYSGAKIKVLMVMTPYGDEQAWGRNKYNSLKDAEGQTWAVASLGGAERFNDQMAIQGMGFKPDAFKWVSIAGGDGPRLEAIVTGRTEIATLSHVGAELAKAKGYTNNVRVLLPHTAKYTPPIPRLVVVARTDWLNDHQEAAARYVEMMLDAGRQWQTDGKSWVTPGEKIYSKSGLNAERLHSVWKEFQDGGYFSVNGGINLAATKKVMDLFFKLRHEKPNEYLSKPSDVYDTRPLKIALDKMGVYNGPWALPDTPDWYKHSGVAGK